jgi:hypothetical protein
MPNRSRKREPEDVNQIAARHIRETESTGDMILNDEDARRAAARALGRLGGLKGGPARAKKLSKVERSQSASKAARTRWEKTNRPKPQDH